MRVLIRISAPHFVAGLIVERMQLNQWRAVDAAPILYWMVKQSWTLAEVEPYLLRKGWTWEVIS